MPDIFAQAGGEALTKAFEAVAGALSEFIQRRREARESRWEELLATFDMVQQLTKAHLTAVNAVVAPALESGDVRGSHERLRALVANDDFPTAYDEAKGVFRGALSMKEFKGGNVETNPMKRLLSQLTDFQFSCFMLGTDEGDKIVLYSYAVDDALEETVRLWDLLTVSPGIEAEAVVPLVASIRSGLEMPLSIFGLDSAKLPPLRTTAQVVEFVRLWCRSWQRHVRDSLYGGRGLNGTIGELRFMSREVLRRREA